MQISLSKYSQHDTKLEDSNKKSVPEDASKSIKEVCMKSIIQEPIYTEKRQRSASQTTYIPALCVYVSPHERKIKGKPPKKGKMDTEYYDCCVNLLP